MTTLVDPRLQSVTISVRSDDTDILADATGSNVRFRFSRNIQIPPGHPHADDADKCADPQQLVRPQDRHDAGFVSLVY